MTTPPDKPRRWSLLQAYRNYRQRYWFNQVRCPTTDEEWVRYERNRRHGTIWVGRVLLFFWAPGTLLVGFVRDETLTGVAFAIVVAAIGIAAIRWGKHGDPDRVDHDEAHS